MNISSHERNDPLLGLAAFVIVVAGMKAASSLIVPLLLAMFLAIICMPPLFWMQKKKISAGFSILLLLFMVVAIWMILATLIGSSLNDFSKNIDFYQLRLKELSGQVWSYLATWGIEVNPDMVATFFDPGRLLKLAANMLDGLGNMLTNTFFIFLTLIFILLEASGFPSKLRAIQGGKESAVENYLQISKGVNHYLAIKTVTSLVTGIVIAIWLSIQGVDFAIMWGVFAFLLNFVPNIGSIIAAVPAVLLALVQLGPLHAGITTAGFLLVNIVVGSIIEPKVTGRGIGLSALVVFFSLAFWGWILGPVGMLLSVPLTMTVKIVLAGSSSTRWISILLGSNREAAEQLEKEVEA